MAKFYTGAPFAHLRIFEDAIVVDRDMDTPVFWRTPTRCPKSQPDSPVRRKVCFYQRR